MKNIKDVFGKDVSVKKVSTKKVKEKGYDFYTAVIDGEFTGHSEQREKAIKIAASQKRVLSN